MRTPPRETSRRMSPRKRRAPSCAAAAAGTLAADRARGQGGALRLRHPDGADPRGGDAAGGRGHRRRAARSSALGFAVKILSEDISHKSDVGGVRLGLRSAARGGAAPPSRC